MIPKRTYDPKKYEGMMQEDIIVSLLKDYTEYELSSSSLTAYYLSKQTGMNRKTVWDYIRTMRSLERNGEKDYGLQEIYERKGLTI